MVKRKDIILILDDEEDLREMIKFQFEARGYEVATGANGVEGLNHLKTLQPDLIILDMNMPVMGGVEFYKSICNDDTRPKFPVLVLTARANMEQLFRDLEIDGFMTKPFEIEQLIAEAEMIIKKMKREGVLGEDPFKDGTKSVFIVEHDPNVLKEISSGLIDAGYKINSAKSGTIAIEKMVQDPPHAALINLGLKDIAGDIVAFRLRRMSRTSDIKLVLYLSKGDKYEHDATVLNNISHKEGIVNIIEYSKPSDLIQAVDRALKI